MAVHLGRNIRQTTRKLKRTHASIRPLVSPPASMRKAKGPNPSRKPWCRRGLRPLYDPLSSWKPAQFRGSDSSVFGTQPAPALDAGADFQLARRKPRQNKGLGLPERGPTPPKNLDRVAV